MDFDLPPEDDPRRLVVRAWLDANPHPTGRQLAAAGYVAPQWPPPWGLGADPVHRLIIDDELDRAGVRRPGGIGIGWAAPTLLVAGTPEQQQRFLPGILSGEDQWCQLFSEPDAGSDLAGLTTRAERDGDEYVVTGSKIWSSGAHQSRYGILLARTDSDAPVATDPAPGSPSRQAGRGLQRNHRGISYFVCPMDLPGITLRPIVDMTTAHSFNQVFFDGVRLPASLRVGDEGAGWRLAKVTLSNERVMLSSSGSLWGSGPSAAMLLDLVRARGGVSDRGLRQRLAMLHCEAEVLRLNRLRTLSAGLAGRTPGPEASIQKIMADEHGQHVMELAKDLAGPAGMLEGSGPAGDVPERARTGPTEVNVKPDHFPGVDPIWHYGFLFAPALTLGGGTFAIQRNIVAEMVLGLPRDPRPA
ncbi:MAG TPA: acyl-CoA dehydrogenase family protein [Acidimicrobiales bacterium]|nr:acyl-CoA dehydrogenase family protein [Acidimicrobiales bacterium]